MDIYTMRYVIAIAEYQNFSMAAQVCHVGQSALSQQIAKLERELGTALFYRNSKGAVLTEAGTEFVRRAREIIQLSESLESEMSLYAGLYKGTVRIGVITSLQCIGFGELLSDFCEKYPGISVNIEQDGTYELLDRLMERKIDVAFINHPVSGVPAGAEFVKLGEDYYHIAVPENHRLVGKENICLTDLRDEPFIFHETMQAAYELCISACRDAGFEPNIICRSGSPTISLYMVRGGLGIALIPSEEFSSRKLDGIVELTPKEVIKKEVGVVWRSDANSPLVKAVVKFSKEWNKVASNND